MLEALPADVLQCVLSRASPSCIVAGVAPVCRALHACARADGLWRIMLETRYQRLLSECFDGVCPPPVRPLSWREHYFAFASSFLQHARARGRLLLEIDAVVYDVSTYLHLHPGDPEVLLAAAGHDATAVFREVGLSRNESAQLVESVLQHMSDALVDGEQVKISSFGTFSVRSKAARVGRNPKTGEEVPINPRRVLSFRPSHLMKERVAAGNKA